MADKRFEITDKENGVNGAKIITDIETGVQYLFVWHGNIGGLTLLVDKEGKPITNKK